MASPSLSSKWIKDRASGHKQRCPFDYSPPNVYSIKAIYRFTVKDTHRSAEDEYETALITGSTRIGWNSAGSIPQRVGDLACIVIRKIDALNTLATTYPVQSPCCARFGNHAKSCTGARHPRSNRLFSHAGIYTGSHAGAFNSIDYEAWAHEFRVNTMATLKMAQAFNSHVARSSQKMIVTISSKMGSIAENDSGGSYLYRSSKAAVNMVIKSLAIDLKPAGIIAVVLHPGWVQTDMGGKNALISTAKSVSGMRRSSEAYVTDSCKFLPMTAAIPCKRLLSREQRHRLQSCRRVCPVRRTTSAPRDRFVILRIAFTVLSTITAVPLAEPSIRFLPIISYRYSYRYRVAPILAVAVSLQRELPRVLNSFHSSRATPDVTVPAKIR